MGKIDLGRVIPNLSDFYPVGSIYLTIVDMNPSEIFGGKWEQIKDRFLLSAGDIYKAGNMGGSPNVTLTTNQMPAHTHTFTGSNSTTGNQSANHTHSISLTSSNTGAHVHDTRTGPTQQQDNKAGYGLTKAGGYTDRVFVNGGPWNTASTGAHAHTVSGNSGNQSASHNHTVKAAGTNANTGGNQAHDNMPPYLSVYMWYRIA